MNDADEQYKDLLNKILIEGREKKSRAGDTLGIFGAQLRFNLQEGFPLLTTKKVHFAGIVHELLWFLSGSTNIKYLVDNNVNIWNADAYRNYLKWYESTDFTEKSNSLSPQPLSIEIFVENLRNGSYFVLNGQSTQKTFAEFFGELGRGTYGQMWRTFPYFEDYSHDTDATLTHEGVERSIDQISKLISNLKSNPDSRRHIVSAWHPYWVDNCVLPPCHVLYQFHTEELNEEERINIWQKQTGKSRYCDFSVSCLDDVPKRRLNCQLYQRSLDVPLGGPYNIASYSLLTHLVAQSVNMVAGDFVWSIGDAHIYKNQIEGIQEQLGREPRNLPRLNLNREVKDISEFKFEHIRLEGYDPHPAIKIPLSVG